MPPNDTPTPQAMLERRYSDAPLLSGPLAESAALQSMIARGSCRSFTDEMVTDDVLEVLCAVALAAPTKSDLQQRDIVLLKDPAKRAALAELVAGQAWVGQAPMLVVFCGNNRRQRLAHHWHEVAFANDHLDALINATADAAIALGAFVAAAEAMGFGCCPISAVRNEAAAVTQLLELPQHVFPFAGLAIGRPAAPAEVSMRLPLGVTCHVDRYHEEALEARVAQYDKARAAHRPYATQRFVQTFGEVHDYGWSLDKVRQYSAPERADFGAYLRAQGFRMD